MMTDDACLDWLPFVSLASTWPQPTKGPHDATLDGCHFCHPPSRVHVNSECCSLVRACMLHLLLQAEQMKLIL